MRMNMKIYSFLLACLLGLVAGAQQTLEVKGKFPNIYVLYVSTGTETLQTVSNQFGFSVAKLSAFNAVNINPAAVLPRGTAIKIPLGVNNLLQQPSENSAPVVHVIKKGDNLYRLSNLYNKVPLTRLREWNKLKNDVVKNGQEVIIGYMVNAKPIAATADKKIVDYAVEELTAITGQKAVGTISKKDEAAFKLRKGMPVGARVTLRADKMYEFLDRLTSSALPRIRDFNGIKADGFDGRGNYNLGITEQIIFPEIVIDKVKKIQGMDITFVTSANMRIKETL